MATDNDVYTLHYFPFSLYSLMVRFALVIGRRLNPETAPNVEIKLVNLHREENFSEQYLTLVNSKGQVSPVFSLWIYGYTPWNFTIREKCKNTVILTMNRFPHWHRLHSRRHSQKAMTSQNGCASSNQNLFRRSTEKRLRASGTNCTVSMPRPWR